MWHRSQVAAHWKKENKFKSRRAQAMRVPGQGILPGSLAYLKLEPLRSVHGHQLHCARLALRIVVLCKPAGLQGCKLA